MANLISLAEFLGGSYVREVFEPEEGASIFDVIPIREEGLVLVKEILCGALAYTFFDIKRGCKIGVGSRILSEDGSKNEKILPDGLKAIKTVKVDPKTGAETVTESILHDDTVLYKSERERYPERTFDEVYKNYLNEKHNNRKSGDLERALVEKFKSSSKKEKIGLIRGEFRNKWRANCELGFENPEFFLSRSMYDAFVVVPEFKSILFEMLEAEGAFVGRSARELFESIVGYYEN